MTIYQTHVNPLPMNKNAGYPTPAMQNPFLSSFLPFFFPSFLRNATSMKKKKNEIKPHLQILLRRPAPALLIHDIRPDNHDLHCDGNSQQADPTQPMLLDDRLDHIRNVLVVVLDAPMHGANQRLVVLALEVAQDLLRRGGCALGKPHVVG